MSSDGDELWFVPDAIGEGANASVYKCRIHDDRYAAKCIRKLDLNEYKQSQLRNEIQILKSINHPLIVELKEVREDEETL